MSRRGSAFRLLALDGNPDQAANPAYDAPLRLSDAQEPPAPVLAPFPCLNIAADDIDDCDLTPRASVYFRRRGVWTELLTPDGSLYYYNSSSGDSVWSPPPGFPALDRVAHAQLVARLGGEEHDVDVAEEDAGGMVEPPPPLPPRPLANKRDMQPLEMEDKPDVRRKRLESTADRSCLFTCCARCGACLDRLPPRDGPSGKDEKCSCCSSCPKVQAFFSRRGVRRALKVTAIITLLYTAYLIWAYFEMRKMADTEMRIKLLTMPSLCNMTVPFVFGAELDNPSAFGLTLHHVSASVRRKGNPLSLGRLEFVPEFRGSGQDFTSGHNYMTLDTAFEVAHEAAVGEMLTYILSDSVRVPLEWDYEADISTSALGFPLRTTLEGTKVTYLNDPDAEQQAGITEAPPPDLRDVGIIDKPPPASGAGEALSVIHGKALAAKSVWQLWPSNPGYHINIPELVARVGIADTPLAEVQVHDFLFEWESMSNIDVGLPRATGTALTKLQDMVHFVTTNTTFVVQVDGETGLAPDSACMMQRAINRMPVAHIEVIPQAYQVLDADLDRTTGTSVAAPTTESSLELLSLAVGSLHRPVELGANTTIRVHPSLRLNFDFVLWGDLPDIHFEAFSFADPVASATVEATTLPRSGGETPLLNVTTELNGERKLWQRFLASESDDTLADLGLIITGRAGHNFVSDILAGFRYDFTSTDGLVRTKSKQARRKTSPPPELYISHNPEQVQLRLSMLFTEWTPTWTLYVPSVDVVVNARRISDGLSAWPAITIHMDELLFGSSTNSTITASSSLQRFERANATFASEVRVSLDQAEHLGRLINDFLADRDVAFSIESLFASPGLHATPWPLPTPQFLPFNLFANFNERDVFGDFEVRRAVVPKLHRAAHWLAKRCRPALAPKVGNASAVDVGSSSLGPATLHAIELYEWTRVLDGSWHAVGLNLSVSLEDLPLDLIVYGDVPSFKLSADTAAATSVGVFSSQATHIARPPSPDTPTIFPFPVLLGTRNEDALLDEYDRLSANENATLSVVVRGDSNAGVVSRVLAEIRVNVTLSSVDSSSAVVETDSTQDDPWSDGPLIVSATSDTTSAAVQLTKELPIVDLPFDVTIGDVNVGLFYTGAGPPSGSPPFRIASASADAVRLCNGGCPATLSVAGTMVHMDNGEELSKILQRFLDSEEHTPLLVEGTAGRAFLNVSFYGTPPDAVAVVDNVVREISDGITTSANRTALDTSLGFKLNQVHILDAGEGTAGEPIIVPCVFPSDFCPIKPDTLTGSAFRVRANMTVPFSLPFPLRVEFPPLDFDFDCCLHDPVFSVDIAGGVFDSRDAHHIVTVTLTPRDLSLLQHAVKEISDAKYEFTMRLHGSRGKALVSSMFQRFEVEVTTEPSDPTSESVADTEESEVLYELAGTSGNSASFLLRMAFQYDLEFPLDLNEVTLVGNYDSVDVLSVATTVNLVPEQRNPMQLLLTVFGQDSLTSRCSGASISNKQFCVANEFISNVINRSEFVDGIALRLTGTFTNVDGQPTTVIVDLSLFAQDPNFPPRATELGLLPDFGAYLSSSAWSFISSVGSSEFDIDVWLDVKNIFNFTVQVERVKLDLYLHDATGVADYWYIPGTPMGPAPEFLLAQGVDQSVSNFVVAPDVVKRVDVGVPLAYSSLTEGAVRLYDEYYVGGRLCVHVRAGSAQMRVQFPGHDPLRYTQEFSVDDMSVIGFYDCELALDCHADTFRLHSFTSFSTATWAETGSGTISSGNWVLTDDDDQVTAVWMREKVRLTGRWVARAQFKMTKASFWALGQADGIALVVHNDPRGLSTRGGGGCNSGVCHGYTGIANSVGVVLDSYLVNEMSVHVDGSSDKIANTENFDEYDDDSWHWLKVVYHGAVKKVYVYLDEVFALVADVVMEDHGFDADGRGYIGFTASTGDAYYSKQQIGTFTFDEILVDITHSLVVEDGRVRGRVGEEGFVTVQLHDSCDFRIQEGGHGVAVVLVLKTNTGVRLPASRVVDNEDGTVLAYFTPATEGEYDVEITVQEQGGVSGVIGTVLVEGA